MVKKIFGQMLITQIVSSMTVMICMLVDSILIGRFLGINSMTAYGLTTPVLLVFVSIGSVLSAGVQVMCGKTMGSGDRQGTNETFSISFTTAAVIAIVGVILVVTLIGPLCTMLGAGQAVPDNEVFFLTKDYLFGFIIGAPAFILAQIMVPYMQMSGNRLRLVIAVSALTVGDIIFDLLNVFVFHGGTLGMGLASSLSYYLAFFIGGAYFLKKDCMFRFTRKGLRWNRLLEMFKHGIPTAINQVSLVLLVFFFNKMLLEVGGNLAVAAYSVISTMSNICYSFGGGIGAVALMLAAIFYGDEDRESLYEVVRTMVRKSIVIDTTVVAVLLAASPLLVKMFLTDNVAATDMATLGLRLFSLSLLFSAVNVSFKNYYQGVRQMFLAQLIAFTESFFFPVLSAFLLSRVLGTTGVWLGWLCGEILTLVTFSGIVWKRSGKVGFAARNYAMLPEDLGARDEDCLDLKVENLAEAMDASMQAEAFCKAHGLPARETMLIPLCIEEMVTNIVDHGFTKDQRTDHRIEVRLMLKEEKRLIRIRDNCVNFDPIEYVKLHEADDPTSRFGIRMIMKMVKDANYVSSLGLNNLTLVL